MKKWSTLIKLSIIVVVLAVIALITAPMILGLINDARIKANEVAMDDVEKAAKEYLKSASNINSVPDNQEYYIPVSALKSYLSNIPSDMTGKHVIVKKSGDSISYYYTGRDNSSTYSTNQTLKAAVESDKSHILKNVKVNGITVNKVIGTRNQKTTMKNWVWYSGQLWQVLETTDNYVKLATANSVTSISYGSTSDWSTSWVRKWLNEIDSTSNQDGIYYHNLSRTDMLLDGKFCLDEPTGITKDSFGAVKTFTPINTCVSTATDKIGLMTFEDYVYSLDGSGISGLGNSVGDLYDHYSYLDENSEQWTMTKNTESSTTTKGLPWYYSSLTAFITSEEEEQILPDGSGLGVRPVIYLSSNTKIQANSDTSTYGTINNPYRLVGEQTSKKNEKLASVTVGSYIYLSEVNNAYTITTENVTANLSYGYNKNTVRYRVIGKNGDGSIKVERADVLSGLPSTIEIGYGYAVPYYYKAGTCEVMITTEVLTGCINHNYFLPNQGSGAYAYTESENIGYYLNNTSNGYYTWLSDDVKNNIVNTTWNLATAAAGQDYVNTLFNTTYTGTYPTRTNDGTVSANIGLPSWGDMFSGNDLEQPYWYINRWPDSSSYVSESNNVAADIYASNDYTAVRPVLNLKANILLTNGDGTPNNPYTLLLN